MRSTDPKSRAATYDRCDRANALIEVAARAVGSKTIDDIAWELIASLMMVAARSDSPRATLLAIMERMCSAFETMPDSVANQSWRVKN